MTETHVTQELDTDRDKFAMRQAVQRAKNTDLTIPAPAGTVEI
jgi:hypothetical protein